MSIPNNDHHIRLFMPVAQEQTLRVFELNKLGSGITLGDINRGSIVTYLSLPYPIFKAKCSTYPFENFVVVYRSSKNEFHSFVSILPIFLAELGDNRKEWVTTEKWVLNQDLENSRVSTKRYYSQFRLTEIVLKKLGELINTGTTRDGKWKLELVR